jgi:O-antigen/teichoic acid export membrane protein
MVAGRIMPLIQRSMATLLRHSTRRLGRELFWVGLGQAFAVLGSIVGVRLLTHAMTADTYGQLALGMTIATLINQTVLGPLAGAFLRFFSPALESCQLSWYLNSVAFLLKRATATIVTLLCLASLGALIAHYTAWLPILWMTVGYALISSYSQAMDGMQNAARQRVVVAWHDGSAPWLRSLIAVALMALLGAYSKVAMLGYLVASLLVLGSQSFFFQRHILILRQSTENTQKARVDWGRQMLTYAWPFGTWGVFYWAQVSSDRWALQWFGTTTMVGLYAILYQLGYYPIMLLSGLLVQLAAPLLFGWAGSGADPERMRRVWRSTIGLVSVVLLLSLVGTALAFPAHGLIFALLVAPEYRGISPLLPGMVLAGGLFAAGQAASLFIMSNTTARALLIPKIATALLGVGFNIIGARLNGVAGVVAANILFAGIYCAWTLWVARHLAKLVLATERMVVPHESSV